MILTPKRLAIDIDGICADFNNAFRNLICQLHGVDKQPPTWPPTKWHWPKDYLTNKQVDACWRHIDASGGDWWEDLEPINADETMNALIDLQMEGHDLYFLTARYGAGVKAATESWFAEELNLWPTVLVGLDPLDKAMVMRALEINVMVDDRKENVDAAVAAGIEHCLLFDQPWNQDCTSGRRIFHLQEVVALCGQ